MFQEFPYTDMHQLNLDWIIKIAKDFLDQYTHLQQLITDGEESLTNLTEEGLTQLQDKADALETLLNAWYTDHSQDIANELASALSDIAEELAGALASISSELTDTITTFNSRAQNIGNDVIASIPSDYTALSNKVNSIAPVVINEPVSFTLNTGFVKLDGTLNTTTSSYRYTDLVSVSEGDIYFLDTKGSVNTLTIALYDSNGATADTDRSIIGTGTEQKLFVTIPNGISYFRLSCDVELIAYLNNCYKVSTFAEIEKRTLDYEIGLNLNVGYVKNDGTLNTTSTAYRYTDLIPVNPGEQYLVKTRGSAGTFTVAFYTDGSATADTDYSILGVAADQRLIVTVPVGIRYMRLTCNVEQLSYLPRCYNYSLLSIINERVNAINRNIPGNYLLRKIKGSVSFIFDDGNNNDTLIKDAFDQCGKKCGFAIYTADDRYREYSDEGFEILAHATGSIQPSASEADVRLIMQTAYNTVYNLVGYCKGWVTPMSSLPVAFRPLVYDYYEYGYTISKGDETNPANASMDNTMYSYNLWRSSLESLSMAEIKNIIDYAAQNHKMICFYAHGTNLGNGYSINDIIEILNYCDSANLDIVTPYASVIEMMSYRHNDNI